MKPASKIKGKVAFLFPGQGRVPEELPPLCEEGTRLFALAERMGFALREWITTGQLDLLQRTKIAQPAIFIDSLAKAETLRKAGLNADFVAGHSLGEYAALAWSGVLTPEEAFSVVAERGRLMADVDGMMAAIVKLPVEEVETICEQMESQVVIANYNGPRQAVISGKRDAVKRALERAEAAGGRGIPLPVSGPFHSPLMASAQAALAPMIERLAFKRAVIPVVSSVSGRVEEDPARLKALLATQITACVRWMDVVESLADEGVAYAVEMGVGNVLTGLGQRISSEVTFLTFEEALDG